MRILYTKQPIEPLKTALFFNAIYPSDGQNLSLQMDSKIDATSILNNARVKGAAKPKPAGKIRKARPLKNIELTVLQGRLLEIRKRVRTAECKITLLKEKLGVHEEELTARADVPVDAAVE